MKQSLFKVIDNKQIAKNTYEMVLSGDTTNCKPGQFVNIQIKGKYLRRPISVCNAENGKLTLIYKVVGSGTSEMATYTNETLDVLHYLGNGYNLEKTGNSPVLIGGGAGIPPLYMLAKELIKDGKEVQVILGFNSKDEIFYVEEFKAFVLRGNVMDMAIGVIIGGAFATKRNRLYVFLYLWTRTNVKGYF